MHYSFNISNAFAMLIGFIVGIYLIITLWPKKSALHKANISEAKKAIEKINEIALTKPAYVFGILRRTNPFVFEEILLLSFKKIGFQIQHNLRYTGDGGIDGKVYDAKGRTYLIQAKRYSQAINPQHVAEFSQTIKAHNAFGGFFIHTGRTGKSAYLNTSVNVKIISGQQLINLITGKLFDGNAY